MADQNTNPQGLTVSQMVQAAYSPSSVGLAANGSNPGGALVGAGSRAAQTTLYGPNGAKQTVDPGTDTAKGYLDTGWSSTPGGYVAPNQAVSTSSAYRAGIASLGNNITGAAAGFDASPYAGIAKSITDTLSQLRDSLAASKKQGDAAINLSADTTKADTIAAQGRETASSATQLARMGGSLGGTGSGMAYLNSLGEKHQTALASLDAARQTALSNATTAYQAQDYTEATKQLDMMRQNEQDMQAAHTQFFADAQAAATLSKLQSDSVSATIDNIAGAGLTADQLPSGYLLSLDQVSNLPPGTSAGMLGLARSAREATGQKDAMANFSSLTDILSKMPAGTPMQIAGVTYYGTAGLGGLQVDGKGMGTIATVDQGTGQISVKHVGFVGKPQDGYTLQIDKYGHPWSYNTKTGQFIDAGAPGTDTPTASSADWSTVLPNGSVYLPADGRDTTGQCGVLVNDLTGLGVGDTLESKTAKIDKTIGTDGNPLKIGDVAIINAGTTGHVAIVNSISTGPDGQTYLRLTESNWKKNAAGQGVIDNTRQISESDPTLLGFARGTLAPALAAGPSTASVTAPQFAPTGAQGSTQTINGVLYNVNGSTATPIVGPDGKPIGSVAGTPSAQLLATPIPPTELSKLGIAANKVGITYGEAQSQGLLTPTDMASAAQQDFIDQFARRYATSATEADRKSVMDQAKGAGVDEKTLMNAAAKLPVPKGEFIDLQSGLQANLDPVDAKYFNTSVTVGNDLIPRLTDLLSTAAASDSTGTVQGLAIKNLPPAFRDRLTDQVATTSKQLQLFASSLFSRGGAVSPEVFKALNEMAPSVDATVAQNLQRMKDLRTTLLDAAAREMASKGITNGEKLLVKDASGAPGYVPIDEFSSGKYTLISESEAKQLSGQK